MLVAVEGIPGSGKGFLLKHVQARAPAGLQVQAQLLEDDISNLLDFQNDPRRWALFTQLSILAARADLQAALRPPGSLCFMEGSCASDRACHAALVTLSEAECAVYEEAYAALQERAPAPDVVVHVQGDLQACFERVVDNSKREQAHVTLHQLGAQQAAYGRFVAQLTCPVIELPCPANFEDNEPQLAELAGEMLRSVQGLRQAASHESPCRP